MFRFSLSRAAIFAAAVAVFPSAASASPVTTYPASLAAGWHVGSGQTNNNFTVTTDSGFSGGSLELGLRVQERLVGSNYVPVSAGGYANAMYNVPTGASPPPNPGDYAVWNLDFSAAYTGGLQNLNNLSITIEELTPGLTPLNNVNLTGLVSGTLAQDSWNPGFDFLSGPGLSYNFNVPGIYRVTLSATENGQTVSDSILVNIGNTPLSAIPEPASVAAFGLMGLAALGYRVRRKKTA